ncbi:MAG TPA: DEAD/DEAH box helicase family protein [Chitinispirillaceae bacterium]|nr:DEAD/DEAH box helicase family protein [Chitinispirillaceae bacterium]
MNEDQTTQIKVMQIEIQELKAENKRLRELLELHKIPCQPLPKPQTNESVTKYSSSEIKMGLYLSFFKGRTDVYAARWQNKAGKSGYSPVCLNEWKNNICRKPQGKCTTCNFKAYKPFDRDAVEDHLTGKITAGIYPMLHNETCCFLAIDFDGSEWQKDVSTIKQTCSDLSIPIAIERSRSGNGAHAWFFFTDPLPAPLARTFGTKLLTFTTSNYSGFRFSSYDRLFPNQDTMPKGGLGNLIALPLQKAARENHNSEFIDEHFDAYPDQWAYLASVHRFSMEEIEKIVAGIPVHDELGALPDYDQVAIKPWQCEKKPLLQKDDFPQAVTIIESSMLFINKTGISSKALNLLKRLASFKNSDFYKTQAMRLSTRGKPRVIYCFDETEHYLGLPRGCKEVLSSLLNDVKVHFAYESHTQMGVPIDITFNGKLREEQTLALDQLKAHKNGILCGTTAFGKTVVAIKLIAEIKVNTLIIVDKISLLDQWKKKLQTFLHFPNESIEALKKESDKSNYPIGILGDGKNTTTGIIDIALVQSLSRSENLEEIIGKYGMIIVDECHHVSAFGFEKVLKSAPAEYVYGLTATPQRKDGHHPIILMQCGQIRFRDDAKVQAANRPFDHYIIPRFTRMVLPFSDNDSAANISKIYAEIATDEFRNQLIVDDIINCHNEGRNSCIITERTAHIEALLLKLKPAIPDIITLTGRLKTSELKAAITSIESKPITSPLSIIATGKFIGEGFDVPRLDTLFLTMPISWKGTLQQYAGRLHRLWDSKHEVRIYDYIDIYIPVLEKMYHRRLNGYGGIGYKIKPFSDAFEPPDIIYDKNSFQPVYTNDFIDAQNEIIITSPYVSKLRITRLLPQIQAVISRKVSVRVITRPADDFKDSDKQKVTEIHELLVNAGVKIHLQCNIHQKFAVIDHKIVWYGSINLLSFGSAEESIMRLNSAMIAGELLKRFGNNMFIFK